MKTITVKYSCAICGIHNREVEVPARESPDEDVKHYVEQVIGEKIGFDHMSHSPECFASVMKDLWIPLPKDDPDAWIGKAEA